MYVSALRTGLAAVAATFLMFTLVSGPALAQERFEIKSLRTPIPHIEATLAAIKQRDVAKAIDAFEAYDSAWNGVEVYVNVRSRPTYELLEINLQNKITKALTGPNPDFAALTADTESLLAEYKKAVDAFAKLPALNSLYDDVTRLRAHLREVTPAIKAGKLAKARKSFEEFADNWDSIEDLIKQRSGEAYVAIEKGMIDIENALMPEKPDFDKVNTLVADVMTQYNAQLAEVVKEAAARAKAQN
jgi:hypothetical protein